MRILHTSDWHLGQKLGQQDLSDDLTRQLHRIAGYLVEHRVDVMLVTGDLFSDRCYQQPERMQVAIQAIGDAFGDFLGSDGTILAISGNHDSIRLLDTFRGILRLALPRRPQSAAHDTGMSRTFHLFTGPENVNFRDKNGQIVQFQVMPFPALHKYLKDEHTNYDSPDARNRLLQQRFTTVLHQRAEAYIQPDLPAVLLSHIQVRGVAVQGEYQLGEDRAILFDPHDIPQWAYAAFGHIHRPQPIGGRLNARYAGSILRLDAGEALDNKSCILFEIGASGMVGEPQVLPLPCPPIAVITINDPREIATLAERYPHAAETLAKINIPWEPSWEIDRDRLVRDVCAIFPRWYERSTPHVVHASTATMPSGEYQIQHVSDTVRNYARSQFAQDTDRAGLLALLEELLTEEV